MRLAFDEYVLDVARRELRRGAELIAVEPQVFDLLFYLAQNPDRVIGRDELLRAVWNGRIVSDSAITNRITAARRAIGDSGEAQRLIRTVSRRGIRFLGRVEQRSAALPVGSTIFRRFGPISTAAASALIGAAVAMVVAWPQVMSSRLPISRPETVASPRVLVSALPSKLSGTAADDASPTALVPRAPLLGLDALPPPPARAIPAVATPAKDVPAAATLASVVVTAAAEQERKRPLADAVIGPLAPIQHINPFHPSDGTYSGALSVKSDHHQGQWPCGFVDLNRTMTIQDGRFSLLFSPTANTVLKGEVDAMGKVTASGSSPQGGAAFEGVVRGRVLTGDITTAYCVFGLRLSRASD